MTDLVVRFGGLAAVDGLSFTARTGAITGLIGPNGAGKTTTFNVCTGLQKPTSGSVRVDGVDVTRLGPPARVRLGLGRTFQQMQLFESMSVAENVALGAEGKIAGSNPLRHLASSPSQRRQIRESAAEALELCGIASLAERPVWSLPTGQRRLLDLARCLAGEPKIMLLDEPSSGLDRNETAQFDVLLREVVEARNVGVLLVEHDMALVNSVCDYVYVLDFGRPLFEGTTLDVMASEAVRAAYLGDPALTEPAIASKGSQS